MSSFNSPKSDDPEQLPFLKSSDQGISDKCKQPTCQFHHDDKPMATRVLSHLTVFVLTSAAWIVVILLVRSPPTYRKSGLHTTGASHQHNITSNAHLISCGNSTTEARQAGCKYDVLLNHWVPSECWDEEFVQEYQDDRSWGAYADELLTQEITSIDDMSERKYYYTSVRDHINHCAIVWKKQYWTLFEEAPAFDSVIAAPFHTDHCAQYLMDVIDTNGTISTKVEIGFAGCWIRH
ncbi:hypothetical protein B0A52_09093 [Exophiala mesophila]|uniref:Ig-like domain-containing protein n=1 Tax=Exophiala mesophila TaxID=212818 RepID=A0A438MWK1_EXOME|nr:hypothetical protein B0A52_09093 [Exophiala mesophila]